MAVGVAWRSRLWGGCRQTTWRLSGLHSSRLVRKALRDGRFGAKTEVPLVRRCWWLLWLCGCGSDGLDLKSAPKRGSGEVVRLPLDAFDAPETAKKSPKKAQPKRVSDRARHRSKRSPRPIGPWGLPNVWRWEGCVLGTSGRLILPSELGMDAELTVGELFKLPQATKVPTGRHKGEPGLRMSDLLGRKEPVMVGGCDGSEDVIDTTRDWWIVNSTSDFIKLIRLDVRSDKVRDVTEVEFRPKPHPGMKPRRR